MDLGFPKLWRIDIYFYDSQIAYSLIEEQEGRHRSLDDYISFVALLADPRYCGILLVMVFESVVAFVTKDRVLHSRIAHCELIVGVPRGFISLLHVNCRKLSFSTENVWFTSYLLDILILDTSSILIKCRLFSTMKTVLHIWHMMRTFMMANALLFSTINLSPI